jgi:tol-pal system protein YbgF
VHPRIGASAGAGRVRARRAVAFAGAPLLLGASLALGGCYAPQLAMLRSGLDSLRASVDTIHVRDSVAYAVLADTRRELGAQRDILLSTRATTGSTTAELAEQMQRLEGKLEETIQRVNQVLQRAPAPAAPATTPAAPAAPGTTGPAAAPAPDPVQLYDQASQDLTQGRYPLALEGYRDFLRRFPTAELADDAQYGVAECFFAQAAFDSAAIAYADVPAKWPDGNRVPPALYKLALSQERLGRNEDSRKTLQDLLRRFPRSAEAQLARERVGAAPKR